MLSWLLLLEVATTYRKKIYQKDVKGHYQEFNNKQVLLLLYVKLLIADFFVIFYQSWFLIGKDPIFTFYGDLYPPNVLHFKPAIRIHKTYNIYRSYDIRLDLGKPFLYNKNCHFLNYSPRPNRKQRRIKKIVKC